jgi:regulator of replication initiation timing
MKSSLKEKTIEAIILNVEEVLGLDPRVNTRKREYIFARAVVYDILRKHLRMSLTDIAKVFNKNHATVLHSLKQLPYIIKYDPDIQLSYNNIVNNWLENVENFDSLLESDLKNRIKFLVNQNKKLNLEVSDLRKEVNHYTGKYKKFYKLVADIEHRTGNNFSAFERKVNTYLNGL